MFAGFQPVAVDPPQARVGRHLGHRLQLQHAVEQVRQLVLPLARHQEVPERTKAAALIGLVDEVALAQNVLQQRALAAVPQRDAFANAPVQAAKVVLHLAEVGQQFTRQGGELDEAFLQRGVAHQRQVARLHARDLGVDLVALTCCSRTA